MKSHVFPLAIISLFAQICLALASVAQQPPSVRQELSESCPVTKPPAKPFIPPPPYWTDPAPDSFWYGTESLWTDLPVLGMWNVHGNVLEKKGAYRTKLVYWRRGFDWRREPEPELIVIAKRLDPPGATTVAADPAHAVFVTTERSGMMTGIDIPTTGCWELSAQYNGHKLSFVVSVLP